MKILIVEDDFISQKKLEVLLTNLGYDTLIAQNGNEGLELWQDKNPDIVITDWIMPEMNGLELCRKIREQEKSQYTYIIMVTSKKSVNDIIEGIEAGADDFITKPFTKEELIVRIRAGLRILRYETKDIVIFSMAKLAESRDSETGNHLERIRHFAKTLTETLYRSDNPPPEIDNTFINNIFLTSPLHDIGKIGIPDYILLKPGRLDDREFEIMKSHCIIGYKTLNDALAKYPKADYLKMSAEIALCHHEKVDGTGYPNGLKQDEIPLAARITSLADVYDALVNKRVYKSAFSHEIARSIILEGKGTHFDPVIVDAFTKCEKQFIQIFDQFAR